MQICGLLWSLSCGQSGQPLLLPLYSITPSLLSPSQSQDEEAVETDFDFEKGNKSPLSHAINGWPNARGQRGISRYVMSENAQPGARLLGDPCTSTNIRTRVTQESSWLNLAMEEESEHKADNYFVRWQTTCNSDLSRRV